MMKKVLFIAALTFASVASYAQYSAGSILANGNLGFNSSSTSIAGTTTMESSNFNLGLKGGYFLADNMALGLGLGFGSGKMTKPVSDTETKTSTFNWEVFGRYYMPYNDKLSFFAELDIMGKSGSETETTAGVSDETKVTEFGVGVIPAFSYLIDPRISLEMGYGFLGYNTSKEVDSASNETKTSGFGLDLDLSTVMLGMTVFF